jgi:hypothetical protein
VDFESLHASLRGQKIRVPWEEEGKEEEGF